MKHAVELDAFLPVEPDDDTDEDMEPKEWENCTWVRFTGHKGADRDGRHIANNCTDVWVSGECPEGTVMTGISAITAYHSWDTCDSTGQGNALKCCHPAKVRRAVKEECVWTPFRMWHVESQNTPYRHVEDCTDREWVGAWCPAGMAAAGLQSVDDNHGWSSCSDAGNGTAVLCCEIFESISLPYMHRSKPPKVPPLKDHTEHTTDHMAAMGSSMWRYGIEAPDTSDPLSPAPGHVVGDVAEVLGTLDRPGVPRASLMQTSGARPPNEGLPPDFLATDASLSIERPKEQKRIEANALLR